MLWKSLVYYALVVCTNVHEPSGLTGVTIGVSHPVWWFQDAVGDEFVQLLVYLRFEGKWDLSQLYSNRLNAWVEFEGNLTCLKLDIWHHGIDTPS